LAALVESQKHVEHILREHPNVSPLASSDVP
jgi:hypothetical protein